ncbi:MAG: adenosine-specific kinase [candidate division Zixibacteria bacterium]|nr:adenosine-specific kinase [candidate division Zixibacteria bacterium]
MEIKLYQLTLPRDSNVILGQSHFIKTAEDLYEILIGSAPGIKFGLAFCEASGPRLVRSEGNDEELKKQAEESALALGAGHSFIIYLRNAFPINVLNAVKNCPEVCRIFCASANPVQVLYVQSEQGRGIIGVIDGGSPVGVETEKDRAHRIEFLQKIGYKR